MEKLGKKTSERTALRLRDIFRSLSFFTGGEK
jgi:hypothetical protein